MKRGIKRMGAAILSLTILAMTPVYAAGEDTQIVNIGGTAGKLEIDDVEVSKTVSETGIENYFDITLTVKARTEHSKYTYDGNTAVVPDLSNIMNNAIGRTSLPEKKEDSRYNVATKSAEMLIDRFKGITSDDSQIYRSIGVTALFVLDPIYSQDMGDYIEFAGFFAKAGTDKPAFAEGNLIGSSVTWDTEGAENTAAVSELDGVNTINWDLTKSAYDMVSSTEGGSQASVCTYTLKYRVRLKNEAKGFAGSADYFTNDTTTLTYEHSEKEGVQTIEYPLPRVNGFFGQLTFKKADSATGMALSGAEFTLKHADNCAECIKGGCDVTISDMTAVSDGDGKVVLDRIPSGHSYTLSETKAPDLHQILRETYAVKISYGRTDIAGEGEHFSDTLSGTVITNDSILSGYASEYHMVIKALPKTGGFSGLGLGMGLIFAAIVMAVSSYRGKGRR